MNATICEPFKRRISVSYNTLGQPLDASHDGFLSQLFWELSPVEIPGIGVSDVGCQALDPPEV